MKNCLKEINEIKEITSKSYVHYNTVYMIIHYLCSRVSMKYQHHKTMHKIYRKFIYNKQHM